MYHGESLMKPWILLSFLFSLFVLAAPSKAEAQAPANWGCDAAFYEDGTCDCGCEVRDPDCPRGTFGICQRSGCGAGQVPWEDQPASCMRSACGDGWRDEAMGETCDGGEALAGRGCNADCSAVNTRWTCGDRAEGCQEQMQPTPDAGVSADAAEPSADAGAVAADSGAVAADAGSSAPVSGSTAADAGNTSPDEPEASSCSAIEGSDVAPWFLLFGLVFAVGLFRRRK